MGESPWNDAVTLQGPMIVADSLIYKKTLCNDDGAGLYPATRFVNDLLYGNASIVGATPTWTTGGGPVQNGNATNEYHTMPAIFGGMFIDDVATYEDQFQNVWIDGDVQFQTGGIGASFTGVNFYGCFNVRQGGSIKTVGAYMWPVNDICSSPSIYVGGVGAGTFHIRPEGSSRWEFGGVGGAFTATSVFLPGVLLQLNNASNSGCNHSNTSPDYVNCGITLNVTNLDGTAIDAGQFNGFAYLPAGSSYSANP